MNGNEKPTAGDGGLNQETGANLSDCLAPEYTTSPPPVSTAALESRLAELDALMSLNDCHWIDYFSEWLTIFPTDHAGDIIVCPHCNGQGACYWCAGVGCLSSAVYQRWLSDQQAALAKVGGW